ncbi:hypothetical protein BS78_08G125600 [Paspalum vaginatum]|nr:hypothetical protein BS78_08G125600 [Paspalum vaginatum]
MVPRFTNPNDQEKHEIENKVRAIGSPYHVYVHTIHGSHVTGNYMMLSSKYAKEYLQRGYKTVRLLHPNNSHTWEVEILLTGKRRYRLGKGWRQFFKDNKLKVGDICLFELMESKRNLTMTVHIHLIQRRI